MKTTATSLAAVIASITFARHGKAVGKPGEPDSQRQLNELGLSQAKKLGEKIAGLPVDLVVSSPLPRAVNTIKIATGKDEIIPLEELGVTDDPKDPLNIMFEALKYSPLVSSDPNSLGYFQHELGENLKLWATTALIRILSAAKEVSEKLGRPVHVVVGGHAVCQPALAWILCQELEGELTSELIGFAESVNLGEAEAIHINLTGADGSVAYDYITQE